MKNVYIGQSNLLRFELEKSGSVVIDASVEAQLMTKGGHVISGHTQSLEHEEDGIYEGEMKIEKTVREGEYIIQWIVNGQADERWRDSVRAVWAETGALT